MPHVDWCLVKRSLTGPEDECGDTGVVIEYDGGCFLALVDVLGHGSSAAAVAALAERFLKENYRLDPVDLMKGLHVHLKGTRGAVAAICRFDISRGELIYAGVGNITTRVFGEKQYRLVPRDGILGYMIASPNESSVKLTPGDILVLSSDGIREHFDADCFPDLLTGPARKIAERLLATFGKENDDASCIVMRYGK